MKNTIKIIGAALALTLSSAAFSAETYQIDKKACMRLFNLKSNIWGIAG